MHSAFAKSGRLALPCALLLSFLMVGCTVLGISPKPAASVIRLAFDKGGQAMSDALEKHVPSGVTSVLNEHYDPTQADTYLDVFYPTNTSSTPLPTLVWVHGGAWVSGDKAQIANYLRIVASQGYTVVGVGYSIAPAHTYPVPVQQVNQALAYIQAHAARLRVDTSRMYLAGDSAGAQIAAQLGNVISEPSYARTVGITPAMQRQQLRGVLLYCGAYDMDLVQIKGATGVFLKTVLWAYAGTPDFATDTRFAPASVAKYVTSAFAPTFISAGNADPLEAQSHAMAQALRRQKVRVDTLFFEPGHQPPLQHEYQFDLDSAAGQTALRRSMEFLSSTR